MEAYGVHLVAWPSCLRQYLGPRGRPPPGFSPCWNQDQGDAVGRKDQADGPGRQRPRFTASISPDIRVAGHEGRNAVKHVFQARFELALPPVLGESRR